MGFFVAPVGRLVFLSLVLLAAFAARPASAHRFDVALLVPLVGGQTGPGQSFLDGFMLATTERDAHPDTISDGHLGGLDVYVSVVDPGKDPRPGIERILRQKDISIIAIFGSKLDLAGVKTAVEGQGIAVLLPGHVPFSQDTRSDTAGFSAAFEQTYGKKPNQSAAQGYNAARRIDAAVRSQGAADNADDLNKNFSQTAIDFTW